jgi:hypothetical protein
MLLPGWAVLNPPPPVNLITLDFCLWLHRADVFDAIAGELNDDPDENPPAALARAAHV